MERLVVHSESCKSCKYCVNSCPKRALSISDKINSKGYLAVEVNYAKCINCGICYNVCPDYVFEILEVEV